MTVSDRPLSRSAMWRRLRAVVPAAVLGCALAAGSRAGAAPIVLEKFEYAPSVNATLDGGTGWSGSWKSSLALSGTAFLQVNADSLLPPPGYTETPAGGAATGSAASGFTAYRGLAEPIDLDTDQDYYLSILTRRGGTAKSMSIALHTSSSSASSPPIAFGHSTGGGLYTQRGSVTTPTTPAKIGYAAALADAPQYLWVLKIAAKSGDGADQVFLSTYRSTPNPQTLGDEPQTWDVVGTETPSNAVLDRISIAMGGSGLLEIDEIRMGSSWADVAPVPEPTGCVLLAAGAGLCASRRGRRRT